MRPVLAFALFATACTTSHVGPGHGGVDLVVADTSDAQGNHTRGTSLQAVFYVGEPDPTPQQQQIGPCQIEPGGSLMSGKPPDLATAGKIEITDGVQTLSISPHSDSTYPYPFTPGAVFQGGESLQLHASGGGVPGFDAVLVAASNVTITEPAKPLSTLLVDRAQDLHVAWTGGTAGTIQVAMEDIFADVFLGGIACTFPASAGNGTIPAAALATLPKGGGEVGIWSITNDVVPDHDWTIHLSGNSEAMWPDGSVVQAPYMVQ